MIQGVSPSTPQPNYPPPNNPQLNQWAEKIEQFMNQNPDAANSEMFNMVRQELDKYMNGTYPFKSIQDVLNDLQNKFFNGSGQLDVYANSGLGNAQPVQDFMKIFGLNPPPVTAMDQMIMNFQQEFHQGLPKGGDDLMRALHEALMQFGSQGIAGFQKWMNQELNTDTYKNASSDAQSFFKQFLSKA